MKTYTSTYDELIQEASILFMRILYSTAFLKSYPKISTCKSGKCGTNNTLFKRELFMLSAFISRITLIESNEIKNDINKYIVNNKQDFIKSMNNE